MSKKSFREVVIDIEANGLQPDKIWCVVAKDIKTEEIFKFHGNTPYEGHVAFQHEFLSFRKEVKTFIGHNLLGYDIYWLNTLLDTKIDTKDVVDTLVLSRLFRPVSPFGGITKKKFDNRVGGHSLEAWGSRLGKPKIHFNDWSHFSQEMLDYCVGDVELNEQVYKYLIQHEKEGFSNTSIRLEHKVAELLFEQERNGFFLDRKVCEELIQTTETILAHRTSILQETFPPKRKLVAKNIRPSLNKDGSISGIFTKRYNRFKESDILDVVENPDGTYNFYELVEFNPNSSAQVGERLVKLGWEPRVFTPTGKPKTDQESLKEAIDLLLKDNPELVELNLLNDFSILQDRNSKAKKWLELSEKDGYVHGQVNPIGAGTHRCSHYNDNMANIPSVKLDKQGVPLKGLSGGFGWECRSCWIADSPEKCIVGADASGIQLRALAHYMNDPEYTKLLLESDIHVVNGLASGIIPDESSIQKYRPLAKTFIYAWLLGAGDEKVGLIVGTSEDEYDALFEYGENEYRYNPFSNRKEDNTLKRFIMFKLREERRKATKKTVATIIKGYKIKQQFLDRTPALKDFRLNRIPKATKEGFVLGLDGRKLWIPNEHLAMSLYLQGFEAVIMKAAMVFYQQELRSKKIPFQQVAFVHDEFQIQTYWEHAETVGAAVVNGIKKAGEYFKTNCPLDGDYKIGRSWAETH